MLNILEIRNLTKRYGAWGFGVYCMAEHVLGSSEQVGELNEVVEEVARDLTDQTEAVEKLLRDCGLFLIENGTIQLRKGIRSGKLLDPESDPDFMEVWNAYGKKVSRDVAFKAWRNLTKTDQAKVKKHVPFFVIAHPELMYRPHLSTYLHQRRYTEVVMLPSGEIIYNPLEDAEDATYCLPGFQG